MFVCWIHVFLRERGRIRIVCCYRTDSLRKPDFVSAATEVIFMPNVYHANLKIKLEDMIAYYLNPKILIYYFCLNLKESRYIHSRFDHNLDCTHFRNLSASKRTLSHPQKRSFFKKKTRVNISPQREVIYTPITSKSLTYNRFRS